MARNFGKGYVPDRGDVVWLDFDPQIGKEQAKRRPAICISPKDYNQKSGLAIFCPKTSKIKGYPFEIPISLNKIRGVILADQVKSLDYRERNATFIEIVPIEVIENLKEFICLLIEG